MLFRYIWSLKACIICFFVVFALILFPNVDIYISNMFFSKSIFIGNDKWNIIIINKILLIFAEFLFALIAIYSLSYSVFIEKNKKNFICYASYVFIMFVGVHGLIVHQFTKNTFGRPRPLQITNFGGEYSFVRAFEFSNQCQQNCSFVSGDVSIMFTCFMLSLMIPLSGIITIKRKAILANSLFLVGIFMCFCRVSLGKHFFTDVTCAMIIVIGFGLVSYRLIFGKHAYKSLRESLL